MRTIKELQGDISALREQEKEKAEEIGRISALHNLMREIPTETLQAVGIAYNEAMAGKFDTEIAALQKQADGIKANRKNLATAMNHLKKAEQMLV